MKNKKAAMNLKLTVPPGDREVICRIAEEIKKAESALITFHARPDGDAVGSALVLKHILEREGVDASVISPTKPPEVYAFLNGFDSIETEFKGEKTDLCFILDCSDSKRLEKIKGVINNSSKVINIDHHQLNNMDALIRYVRPGCSSVCELILNIALEMKTEIDYNDAACLYTGIVTDTNRFQEKSTTARAHRIAAEFMKNNLDPVNISLNIYGNLPLKRLRLISKCINNLKVTPSGRIAYIVVTPQMLQETGTTDESLEGIINYPRSVKGVEVGVLFRKIPGLDGVKVSFRSRGAVDVGRISAVFGGGGHHNAGGCLVKGSFEEVVEKVVGELKKWME